MNLTTLQQKIEKAPDLDFGDIFNNSIELFKKVWVQGFLVILLSALLIVPLIFVLYLPMVSIGLINPEFFENNAEPSGWLIIPMIGFYVVFLIFVSVVGFLMRAAFYRICKNKDLEIPDAEDYFYYFKKDYLGKAVLLGLMTAGISIVALLLCGLPMIYAAIPINFIPLFFAFNPDLSAKELLKASFKLGTKKWLLIFGLTIVAGFAAQVVGMFLCFVGVFVTASFSLIPQYMVYKKTIGFDEAEEEKPQENNTNENLFLK